MKNTENDKRIMLKGKNVEREIYKKKILLLEKEIKNRLGKQNNAIELKKLKIEIKRAQKEENK